VYFARHQPHAVRWVRDPGQGGEGFSAAFQQVDLTSLDWEEVIREKLEGQPDSFSLLPSILSLLLPFCANPCRPCPNHGKP